MEWPQAMTKKGKDFGCHRAPAPKLFIAVEDFHRHHRKAAQPGGLSVGSGDNGVMKILAAISCGAIVLWSYYLCLKVTIYLSRFATLLGFLARRIIQIGRVYLLAISSERA